MDIDLNMPCNSSDWEREGYAVTTKIKFNDHSSCEMALKYNLAKIVLFVFNDKRVLYDVKIDISFISDQKFHFIFKLLKKQIIFEKVLKRNPKFIGVAKRTIDFDKLVVNSEKLELICKFRNKGLGTDFAIRNLAIWKALGLAEVRMRAGKDLGGYIWPSIGFTVRDGNEFDSLRSKVLAKMENEAVKNSMIPEERIQLIDLIKNHKEVYSSYNSRNQLKLRIHLDLGKFMELCSCLFNFSVASHKKADRTES